MEGIECVFWMKKGILRVLGWGGGGDLSNSPSLSLMG